MAVGQDKRASVVGQAVAKAPVTGLINLRPEIVLLISLISDNANQNGTDFNPRQIFSNNDYKAIYGYGSPLSLAIEKYFIADGKADLWVLPIKPEQNFAPASAKLNITKQGKLTQALSGIIEISDQIINFSAPKNTTEQELFDTIKNSVENVINSPIFLDVQTTGTPETSGTFITKDLSSNEGNLLAISKGSFIITINNSDNIIENINLTTATTIADVAEIINLSLGAPLNTSVTEENNTIIFTNNLTGSSSLIEIKQAPAQEDLTTANLIDIANGTATDNTFIVPDVNDNIANLQAITNGVIGYNITAGGITETGQIENIDLSSTSSLDEIATSLTSYLSSITNPIIVTVVNTNDLQFTVGISGDTVAMVQPELQQDLTTSSLLDIANATKTNGTDDTRNSTGTFKTKFSGVDSNNLYFKLTDINGKEISIGEYGLDITVDNLENGAGIPDLEPYLTSLPNTIEFTRFINQFTDNSNLDKITTFLKELRKELTSQYAIAYYNIYDINKTLTENFDLLEKRGTERSTDPINCLLPFNAKNLAIETVSIAVSKIAGNAAESAGRPIRGIRLEEIKQYNQDGFSYDQRDTLLKKGISNVKLDISSYKLQDILVHYHTPEDNITLANPAILQLDEDITAIANILYDTRENFEGQDWNEVKFLEENDESSEIFVRKLSDVIAYLFGSIRNWINQAFIRDEDFAKENITVEFNSTNPERIDINFILKLARTGRIYNFNYSFTKN